MTSSTPSNPFLSALSRTTSSHRSRAMRRNRNRPGTRPVDVNNNSSSAPSNILRASNSQNGPVLDRMAIMKAFASQLADPTSLCGVAPPVEKASKYEKPTSAREARRARKARYEPAVQQEFIRLRDTVPSIAGSNASDLTIINEAISLICDLEYQLIHKLQNQVPPSRFLK